MNLIRLTRGNICGPAFAGDNIALVTDAGTPAISDPGEELVRMCLDAGIEVTSLPGPAACVTALTMSGLSARRFCFEGFLPTDKKERNQVLERLKNETRTTVMYEAPHRLVRTMEILEEVLGDRRIVFCKKLTKKHERRMEMTCREALACFEKEEPRGEFVLVIEGQDPEVLLEEERSSWEQMSIEEHMEVYTDRGMNRKEAMKAVAADRGVSKRDIYQALLDHEQGTKKEGWRRLSVWLRICPSGCGSTYSRLFSVVCHNTLPFICRERGTLSGMNDDVLADLRDNKRILGFVRRKYFPDGHWMNDTYLRANGQADGIASYDKMVDLIISYCKDIY